MDWLRREIAPLSGRVWEAVDQALHASARNLMAARHIADFDGPRGWSEVAVRVGPVTEVSPADKGTATLLIPEVALLTEIRAYFHLSWSNIESYERGAAALDTAEAEEAGRSAALAEDRLLFYGGQGRPGFLSDSVSPSLELGDWSRPGQADKDVLEAVSVLDRAGIPGPYVLVLDTARYYILQQASASGGGYPATKQLRGVLQEVHRSQVLLGGAVFSTRGGDFVLTVGGDLTVGYRWHDDKAVHLFCAETVAAQVLTPAAVCVLKG